MHPTLFAMSHDAASLFSNYAKYGHPVDCGPDWSRAHIEQLLLQCHHCLSTNKAAVKQI
jgi:hypothetical protein